MPLSSEEFLVAAVIQELTNKFNVIYSNEMHSALPYYTDVRTLFRKNEYTLLDTEDGEFALRKKGAELCKMNLGIFGSTFINSWVEHSGIEGVSLLPVGFAKYNAKAKQGALARSSPKLLEELEDRDISLFQSDSLAVQYFLSDEVVKDGKEGLYAIDSRILELVPSADFEEKVDGETKVNFDGVSDDESDSDEEAGEKQKAPPKVATVAPFYYAISMKKKGVARKKLPSYWVSKIKEDGLSWNFVGGVLYVSNTKGTSYGFPPAPKHIVGLPELDLTIEDWPAVPSFGGSSVKPPADDERSEASVADTAQDSTWIDITRSFYAKPGAETYSAFCLSGDVAFQYGHNKGNPGYKMGSNKVPQLTSVRATCLGAKNAIPWERFAAALKNAANPKDDLGLLMILFKIKGQLVTNEDTVYVRHQ